LGLNVDRRRPQMHAKTDRKSHPEPRSSFPSSVPLTPGEQAAASSRWERRGLLRRLIRH
jgi:hypothetical protein